MTNDNRRESGRKRKNSIIPPRQSHPADYHDRARSPQQNSDNKDPLALSLSLSTGDLRIHSSPNRHQPPSLNPLPPPSQPPSDPFPLQLSSRAGASSNLQFLQTPQTALPTATLTTMSSLPVTFANAAMTNPAPANGAAYSAAANGATYAAMAIAASANAAIQRAGERPARARRNPSQEAHEGRNEPIVPPYPWATNQRARIHSEKYLLDREIRAIRGKVQCKKCEKNYEIEYDLVQKFREVAAYAWTNQPTMHDRAPEKWSNPELPTCKFCGQENSVKPVFSEGKDDINWLFLLLGQMLGCCTIEQLKQLGAEAVFAL
ncbi:hypothetical protein Ancab_018125 [Ancistrocladus abbreviatus]